MQQLCSKVRILIVNYTMKLSSSCRTTAISNELYLYLHEWHIFWWTYFGCDC